MVELPKQLPPANGLDEVAWKDPTSSTGTAEVLVRTTNSDTWNGGLKKRPSLLW